MAWEVTFVGNEAKSSAGREEYPKEGAGNDPAAWGAIGCLRRIGFRIHSISSSKVLGGHIRTNRYRHVICPDLRDRLEVFTGSVRQVVVDMRRAPIGCDRR